MIFYINGKFVHQENAKIDVRDIGFLRSYGVFDFFVTFNNRPFLLDEHIDRLYNSASLMGININKTKNQIRQIILKILSKNSSGKEKAVRIIVTGGVGVSATEPSSKCSIVVIVENRHFLPKTLYNNGAKVITYAYSRYNPQIKSLEYATAINALALAKQKSAIEAIYFEPKSKNITEATTSNVFMVKNGKIYTTKNNILFGVTRNLIIELCKKDNKVIQRNIKLSELISSDEFFLTSSNKDVLPIVNLDNKIIGNGKVGPITKKVMLKFENFVKKGKW